MNSVGIKFVGFQIKRWIAACLLEQRTVEEERDRLPYRQAIDYSDMLRQNITSGKFDSGYSPYNMRYFNWKYNVFKSTGGFWKLRGELLAAISVFKMREGKSLGWMGGIPSGETDSGNVSWFGTGDKGRRMPIAQYARWLEFGRRGQPERPLFQPTLVEYKDGGAKKQLAITSLRIKGAWK